MLIATRVRNIYAANLGLQVVSSLPSGFFLFYSSNEVWCTQDPVPFPAASPFISAIESQTTKLAALSTFNCAIYLPTYERLLNV